MRGSMRGICVEISPLLSAWKLEAKTTGKKQTHFFTQFSFTCLATVFTHVRQNFTQLSTTPFTTHFHRTITQLFSQFSISEI